MIEPFVLLQEEELKHNEKVIQMLKKLKNPHIIIILGKARHGKSTTLNQLIDGPNSKELNFINPNHFKTGYTPDHVTEGCNMYFSIKLHDLLNSFNLSTNDCDNADIILVDTEGFESLDGSSMFLVPGILTLLQISTESIYYTVSNPSIQVLKEIEENEKLTMSLKDFARIKNPEKVVYGAQYNLNQNYRKSDPLETKIKQLNDERKQFQENFEGKLHTKTIIGPFKQEKEADQDDPILHVYWDSLKDIVLSIKESVIKRGQQEGNSMAKSIETLFDFFKEYGNNIAVDQNFPEIVKQIFQKILDKQIEKTKPQIEAQLYGDYSLCIQLKVGEQNASNLILKEINAEMFQNVIPIYYENKMNPFIQSIEKIADSQVNSQVNQFLYILEDNQTVQALADKSIQNLKDKQFQENVDMNYVDYVCDTNTILNYVSQRDAYSRLTANYLFAHDNLTITRQINLLNAQISKIIQAEYQKLPKWKYIISDIRNKAYQIMNQENDKESRKSLESFKTMFLDEIEGQYELDYSKTREVEKMIEDIYNSTQWKFIISDIKDEAYQKMNQDVKNKRKESLESYQIFFTSEIEGQIDLDDSKTEEIEEIIEEIYNSTQRIFIISDTRDKAYARMNQDIKNNSRRSLESYQTMFLDEIEEYIDLDYTQTNEVKQIIQDIYNSTEPPKKPNKPKKDLYQPKVVEKVPTGKKIFQAVIKGVAAIPTAVVSIPVAIANHDNYFETTGDILDGIAEVATDFIPNKTKVVYEKVENSSDDD